MRKAFIAILALASIVCICFSCSKSQSGVSFVADCTGAPKTFVDDVNPIIQGFCNSPNCHTNGSSNGPGPLTNYNQVFNSRGSVRDAISSGLMPRNTTLSASQKSAIICWIDSGAPNN
jgi:hypothetical protein